MKINTKYRFLGLTASLVCFSGGVAYADQQSAPDDPLENLPAISSQEQKPRQQYTMKFVPPSPGVDYKMLRIEPDPTIDYKIMITGPSPELDPVKIETREEELPLENN